MHLTSLLLQYYGQIDGLYKWLNRFQVPKCIRSSRWKQSAKSKVHSEGEGYADNFKIESDQEGAIRRCLISEVGDRVGITNNSLYV